MRVKHLIIKYCFPESCDKWFLKATHLMKMKGIYKLYIAAVILIVCYVSIASSNRKEKGRNPTKITKLEIENKKIIYEKEKLSKRVTNETIVDWGLTLPNDTSSINCSLGGECYDFGVAQLVVDYDEHCETLTWTTESLTELKDCVILDGHWYGGSSLYNQPWPVEKEPRVENPYVTADYLARPQEYGGVLEAYWISSNGVAVKVDNQVPLFISFPDEDGDDIADKMCLSSRYEFPYTPAEGVLLSLKYSLCYANDIREIHELTYPKFFPLPASIPDEQMMTYPIWSTWAEYKTMVNSSRVIELAQSIIDYGFNNSQIEIDDNWETCYGNADFNLDRFPDPKAMVDTLHSMNFRVTLWIHPFINDDCASFVEADRLGYFIKGVNGSTSLTKWWQGDTAGLIDFSNTEATQWWIKRLEDLRNATGIDNYKFDAGETAWIPDDYTLLLNETLWPNHYTTAYSSAVSAFGDLLEVRVGHGTQQIGHFVRMLDKDSRWTKQNGLRTMIPALLQSGLAGYPFVLPDMIGGNSYGPTSASAELFIRWAQSNAFMPSMQFSLLPWNYGDESDQVVSLSKEATALHAQFAPIIIELSNNAMQTGMPMMRPTWWLCPKDEDCLMADQQFLLGDDYLITPVVYEGATTLDVVFPPGTWRKADDDSIYVGPVKATITGVTIASNIYFQRV